VCHKHIYKICVFVTHKNTYILFGFFIEIPIVVGLGGECSLSRKTMVFGALGAIAATAIISILLRKKNN
jgi:hypothetical protein